VTQPTKKGITEKARTHTKDGKIFLKKAETIMNSLLTRQARRSFLPELEINLWPEK
jgi:hypothetical protein